MNSQNTPVHIRLWHHDFWRMAIANLLLTMSVYMLIPTMPLWLVSSQHLSLTETGWVMGAFGIGLFLLGAFTSYLVQRFRRNMVCVWAVLLMMVCLGGFYYLDGSQDDAGNLTLLLVLRVLLGAAFGLAQMVLASTLIIDTSESFQRTEANHAASWFARFSLSLGPMAALIIGPKLGFPIVLLVSGGCALLAIILILLVHFPFRAPDDHVRGVSLDRFFLPHGFLLFVNLLLVTLAAGLVLSLPLTLQFYAMMMVGFLMAILAQRFVFREAELKSEVVSGLVLGIAALLMSLTRSQAVVHYVSPLFMGFSLGIIGSRFLLFFIKLSRHCQRGTSQSTYMLGWESGIVFGLGLGYTVFQSDRQQVLFSALALAVAALMLYQYTHHWFIHNKNR
ncbi:MAG: MFS transporter [Prevotella sp.]|nr:MFS transporter [Prevotella sp.]